MVHFHVPDMTCGGCARRIDRAIALAQMPAGVEVEIDVAARQVRIHGSVDDDTEELVRSAIERAGYTAEVAVATPSRPSAGGCCCAPRSGASIDVNQNTAAQMSPCCN